MLGAVVGDPVPGNGLDVGNPSIDRDMSFAPVKIPPIFRD